MSDIKITERNPFKLKRHYDRGERGLTATQIAQRAWATEAVEGGLLQQDQRTESLMKTLAKMRYDDVLVCDKWRLELLYIGTGTPHFRLYWRGYCFGVARIYAGHALLNTSNNLELVQRRLAALLILCGWTDDCIQARPGKARTRITANTDHMYSLFKARAKRRAAPRYSVSYARQTSKRKPKHRPKKEKEPV